MAYIDLHVDNPPQVSAAYPFSSIGASANADANANADIDAQCGKGISSCHKPFLEIPYF